ncbi:MAG: HEAT repeat domain-containing protein [Candidatus Limnocylindrales bacterium]
MRMPRVWSTRHGRRVVAVWLALVVGLGSAGVGCGSTDSTPSPSASGSASFSAAAQALEALAHGTATERAAAAAELAALGEREAVPALVVALSDESWTVRWRAAAALGTLRDVPALEPLLAMTAIAPAEPAVDEADLNAAARAYRAAVTALGEIGDVRAVDRLAAIAFGDDPADAAVPARKALQSIGAPAIPGIRSVIATLPVERAASAIGILASLGPTALGPLAALLKDARPAVRSAAAAELAGFGTDAVKPLLSVLGGTDRALRGVAARSLGTIGDPSATAGLVRLLADSQNVSPATWALAKIHADDATPLVRYLGSKSTVGVYRALIRVGQADTVSALAKALRTFGTKAMAVAYLNCGNPTLEKAARTWADDHGYKVVTQQGSREEQWGSG